MDNDIKIAENTSVQEFLQDELIQLTKETVISYDLDTEYAKTRKNKSWFTLKVLVVCFAVVALLTLGLSAYISYKANNINVNISVFDDLNLKALLDSVSRTQSMYQDALKSKKELETSLAYILKDADEKRSMDLFTLESLGLDKNTVRARTDEIEREYQAAVAAAHDEYDARIEAADAVMQEYKAQLDEYNNAGLQAQIELDSERQLHQAELQRVTDFYEKILAETQDKLDKKQRDSFDNQKKSVSAVTQKYQADIDALDPTIVDMRGAEIILQATGDDSVTHFNVNSYIANIQPVYSEPPAPVAATQTEEESAGASGESAMADEESEDEAQSDEAPSEQGTASPAPGIYENSFVRTLRDAQRKLSDYDYVHAIVASIPQQYSIPEYVGAMNALTYQVADELARSASEEIGALSKENDLLGSIFLSKTTNSSAQGIVLSVEPAERIPVYIKPQFRPEEKNVPAHLLRGDSELATVLITEDDGLWYAVPENLDSFSKLKLHDSDIIIFFTEQERAELSE